MMTFKDELTKTAEQASEMKFKRKLLQLEIDLREAAEKGLTSLDYEGHALSNKQIKDFCEENELNYIERSKASSWVDVKVYYMEISW